VVAIKMEWEGQRDAAKRRPVERLLDVFHSHNMKIYALSCWPNCGNELVRGEWLLWPDDILITNTRQDKL
jgi:hypothetical protein